MNVGITVLRRLTDYAKDGDDGERSWELFLQGLNSDVADQEQLERSVHLASRPRA